MAGDVIDATAKYYYSTTVSATNTGIFNNIANSLVGVLSTGTNVSALIKSNVVPLLPINGVTNPLSNFISTLPPTQPATTPRAFLNIVFFDEQFRFVSNGSTVQMVESITAPATFKDTDLRLSGVKAPNNGYVYIYLSNESNNIPVYFDDFIVLHTRGAITEDDAYYPSGLRIAGISGQAAFKPLSKYGYQGDFAEEDAETGYNEFDLRTYDPQIGRFIQADPYGQFPSPYTGMGNDPVNNVDPSGGWSLASITGSTNILFNTVVTTIGGALVGGIIGMTTGDDKGWLKGASVGAAVGLGVSFEEDINVLADIFRTGLQIENRIIGRSLNDLGDHLMDAEDKLNRRDKKDRDDFKNHFGIDDDNSMDLVKSIVVKEQNLVKDYLKKRTYKSKIKHTHIYDNAVDDEGNPLNVFAEVTSNDVNHNVRLEKYFWKAPRRGIDSRLGTLAHELSHFNDSGGTGDDGGGVNYGPAGARNRALSRPQDALKTADSFEYYIEKIRLK